MLAKAEDSSQLAVSLTLVDLSAAASCRADSVASVRQVSGIRNTERERTNSRIV